MPFICLAFMYTSEFFPLAGPLGLSHSLALRFFVLRFFFLAFSIFSLLSGLCAVLVTQLILLSASIFLKSRAPFLFRSLTSSFWARPRSSLRPMHTSAGARVRSNPRHPRHREFAISPPENGFGPISVRGHFLLLAQTIFHSCLFSRLAFFRCVCAEFLITNLQ